MHQHDILPTPRNFELWFTYLSDSNPALSHRLSALLGAGMAPTPQQLRSLYADCMTQEIDIDIVEMNGQPLACVTAANSSTEYEAFLTIIPGPLLQRIYA